MEILKSSATFIHRKESRIGSTFDFIFESDAHQSVDCIDTIASL